MLLLSTFSLSFDFNITQISQTNAENACVHKYAKDTPKVLLKVSRRFHGWARILNEASAQISVIRVLLLRQYLLVDQVLSNLNGISGSTFTKVVSHDPAIQRIYLRKVSADTSYKHIILAF